MNNAKLNENSVATSAPANHVQPGVTPCITPSVAPPVTSSIISSTVKPPAAGEEEKRSKSGNREECVTSSSSASSSAAATAAGKSAGVASSSASSSASSAAAAVMLNLAVRGGGAAQHIGKYKIIRTIGKGNFAKVKLAQHVTTQQQVAIKFIDKTMLNEVSLKKLKREVTIMKKIDHPNIVKLYEVIESERHVYLVMEYLSKGEIFDYLVNNGRMKEKQARKTFREILCAVHYLHALGIVHRDLKAENLLLDAQMHVKLVDFGFANYFKLGAYLDTFCGSPPYAAPELFQGKKYEGPEVDVWSLGVILYTLVCGALPFDGRNMKMLREKVIKGKYIVPFFMTPDCELLLKKMLLLNAKRRYSLAQIMRDPWINLDVLHPEHDSLSNQLRNGDVNSTIGFDAQRISKMVSMGFLEQDVWRALEEEHFNNITATYYLLAAVAEAEQAEQQVVSNDATPPRSATVNGDVLTKNDNETKPRSSGTPSTVNAVPTTPVAPSPPPAALPSSTATSCSSATASSSASSSASPPNSDMETQRSPPPPHLDVPKMARHEEDEDDDDEEHHGGGDDATPTPTPTPTPMPIPVTPADGATKTIGELAGEQNAKPTPHTDEQFASSSSSTRQKDDIRLMVSPVMAVKRTHTFVSRPTARYPDQEDEFGLLLPSDPNFEGGEDYNTTTMTSSSTTAYKRAPSHYCGGGAAAISADTAAHPTPGSPDQSLPVPSSAATPQKSSQSPSILNRKFSFLQQSFRLLRRSMTKKETTSNNKKGEDDGRTVAPLTPVKFVAGEHCQEDDEEGVQTQKEHEQQLEGESDGGPSKFNRHDPRRATMLEPGAAVSGGGPGGRAMTREGGPGRRHLTAVQPAGLHLTLPGAAAASLHHHDNKSNLAVAVELEEQQEREGGASPPGMQPPATGREETAEQRAAAGGGEEAGAMGTSLAAAGGGGGELTGSSGSSKFEPRLLLDSGLTEDDAFREKFLIFRRRAHPSASAASSSSSSTGASAACSSGVPTSPPTTAALIQTGSASVNQNAKCVCVAFHERVMVAYREWPLRLANRICEKICECSGGGASQSEQSDSAANQQQQSVFDFVSPTANQESQPGNEATPTNWGAHAVSSSATSCSPCTLSCPFKITRIAQLKRFQYCISCANCPSLNAAVSAQSGASTAMNVQPGSSNIPSSSSSFSSSVTAASSSSSSTGGKLEFKLELFRKAPRHSGPLVLRLKRKHNCSGADLRAFHHFLQLLCGHPLFLLPG